jgi:hypothetical protein
LGFRDEFAGRSAEDLDPVGELHAQDQFWQLVADLLAGIQLALAADVVLTLTAVVIIWAGLNRSRLEHYPKGQAGYTEVCLTPRRRKADSNCWSH